MKQTTEEKKIKFDIKDDFEDKKLPNYVFSASQYGMWNRCGKQYEFRYIEGLTIPPSIGLMRGSIIHRGVEAALRSKKEKKLISEQETVQFLVDNFDKQAEFIEDWEEQEPGELKDIAIEDLKVYYHTAIPVINPVEIEKAFAKKVGTVPMVGVVDLIDKAFHPPLETKTEIITDLKTTSKKWDAKKIKYDPQLPVYAAVHKNPAVRFDFLLSYKKGTEYKQEPTIRTPKDIQSLIENLEETVDYIKKGFFPKCFETDWVCSEKWCGYWKLCRGK